MRWLRLIALALTLTAMLLLAGCSYMPVENHAGAQTLGSPVFTLQPQE